MKRPLFSTLFVMLWLAGAAFAQAPSDLPSSEATDFLGKWKLAMEIQGNPVEMELEISDAEGKTAARLVSERTPEGTGITDIKRDGDTLQLSWPRDFQGQQMTLNMVLERSEESLTGTFGDADGFFSSALNGTGVAQPADQQRRRRRVGPKVAKVTIAGQDVQVNHDPIPADEEILATFSSLSAGEVAHWTRGRAIKLFTDQSLDFSGTIVEAENVAYDYPGVYSIWPKKTADGWSLVFNEESDIWGTMRVAAADVGETKASYKKLEEAVPTLAVELEETEKGGSLIIRWGPHAWTASFALEP